MYFVCGFLCFQGCIKNELVEIFYENVWGTSIAIGKDNQLESIFIGDRVMFDGFLNGGWPCRYSVKNLSLKKMFQVIFV